MTFFGASRVCPDGTANFDHEISALLAWSTKIFDGLRDHGKRVRVWLMQQGEKTKTLLAEIRLAEWYPLDDVVGG